MDEDQSEVVVRDLAGVAHEEVGRDEAFGARELATPSLDLADDRAMPDVGIRALNEASEPHATKTHTVPVVELDRACFVERQMLAERKHGLKGRIAALNIFERAPSLRPDLGWSRAPSSARST